jgi:DNA-directed RNA polymerase subunit RPC12/RpoP
MDEVTRFDMKAPPKRQKTPLKIFTWLLSFPIVWTNRLKINRENMKGLKPPYLLLCTHKSFIDFMVTTACIFPHRANYVVAIDGFIGREKLLRNVGCICKRKFTNDVQMVMHLRKVIDNGDILVIYPEARYSLIGTNACLPESLGKLAKFLKVPVVTLSMHGNFLRSPVWNLHKRHIPLAADLRQIITADEIKTLPKDEIFQRINDAFFYDEYLWQKENGIRIRYKDRAKGLHKVLYKCRHCGEEYQMRSDGATLWCDACGSQWTMTEYGELEARDAAERVHIPSWYEALREDVRQLIKEGEYFFSSEVVVDSLPNADGYIRLGEGRLTHDMNGFTLEGVFGGEPFLLKKDPLSMYSCHIEYDYQGRGDCIDLSTLHDTYYIYPKTDEWSATKISLATEELYNHYARG